MGSSGSNGLFSSEFSKNLLEKAGHLTFTTIELKSFARNGGILRHNDIEAVNKTLRLLERINQLLEEIKSCKTI
jgi:hypothetical protein